MRYSPFRYFLSGQKFWARVVLAAFVWMGLISGLHYRCNHSAAPVRRVAIGYMPVVTNLAAPLLDHATRKSGTLRFDALKFASFAEMAEAIRCGELDVGMMIAPLAILLRQQGVPIQVVYVGNRHESTLVTAKRLNARAISDLAGKTVAVPMRFSPHYLGLMSLLERQGMEGEVTVVEMNPPDMPAALSSGGIDGYFVGEPFAYQAVAAGTAEELLYGESIRDGFICNVMVVTERLIREKPETVRTLVTMAAESGMDAARSPDRASDIVSAYWSRPSGFIRECIANPVRPVVWDRFVPRIDEFGVMAREMKRFGLSASDDVSGLVNDSFALAASPESRENSYIGSSRLR